MPHEPRTIVVTGASGGVGRATAVELGAKGDRVALLARGSSGLMAAADQIREAGGTAFPIQVDVSQAGSVDEAAARVEHQLGPIDAWVNCAFTSVFAPFDQIDPDEYRRVTEVSYLGYVYGTLAALRWMLPRDRGAVVQVGSALAYRGIPLQSAYCAAKHAVEGFHDSVRTELMHRGSGVHTTMVQLPAVNTPQFDWVLSRLDRRPQPVPPIYQPEVAARAIGHAIDRPQRREYWVGGSTAATVMANRIAPGLLDRYLARTAISSQQTNEAQPDNAPANLWEPADEERDFGARGRFTNRSHGWSLQLWVAQHRGVAAAALGTAIAAVAGTAVRRHR